MSSVLFVGVYLQVVIALSAAILAVAPGKPKGGVAGFILLINILLFAVGVSAARILHIL